MSAAASAQIAPGRSGMSTSASLSNVRAFRDLSNFGHCFVQTQRSSALSLIATEPGSREEAEISRRLMRGDQNCLFGGTNVTMSVVYFRGVVAEALLRSNTPIPASFRLPAPPVADVHSLADVARCYAGDHRTQAQTVLATEAGSPEEGAAVAAIWNDFRTCLPPDARVRLNAPWIRFLLAEALLRLSA